jgi:hypothetical protein
LTGIALADNVLSAVRAPFESFAPLEASMFSALRRLWTAVFCLLALTSLTPMSCAQNVTTWHNDIGVTQTMIGPATSFSVPTIFQSRVHMGTKMEVDVFGLCSSQQTGCLH